MIEHVSVRAELPAGQTARAAMRTTVPSAAALAAPKNGQHSIRGTAVRITVLNYSNTSDIAGSIFGYGHARYLGKYTFVGHFTSFVITSPTTFTDSSVGTLTGARGDQLFESSVASGTFTTATAGGVTVVTGSTLTSNVATITGGTGSFAHATGTWSSASGPRFPRRVGAERSTTRTGSSSLLVPVGSPGRSRSSQSRARARRARTTPG